MILSLSFLLKRRFLPLPVLDLEPQHLLGYIPIHLPTEELYKKDLHDPDNHDDTITNLVPDILECEVKWALESITTNKARGGDGIPVELNSSNPER